MAKCKNCGETDLYSTDICGDYCVYCLNLEEIQISFEEKKERIKDEENA